MRPSTRSPSVTVSPPPTNYPPGLVTTTTWGLITGQTAGCREEMRSYSEKQGIQAIWEMVYGGLVDAARNGAVARLLANPQSQWLLFVDGDCLFNPDALQRLLNFAYVEMPAADVVGAYNPLRQEPHLPTIDTGTGTWEPIMPYSGPMPVMRTGTAFVLMKRHVYERIEAPWYGTRNPMRPIDAMHDVDNWANQRFDGNNPLREHPAWNVLFKCATDDASAHRPHDPLAFTGEDSGFADRVRMAGMQIWCHTDIECKHLNREQIISAGDHQKILDNSKRMRRAMCGVLAA